MTEPSPGRPARARAVVTVILGLTACGAIVGGIWALVAPPVRAVVAITHKGERVHDYLGSASDYLFVAPFVMLGLLSVVAVVAPVLAWQCRQRRGPGMLLALSAGLLVAAATATGVAALLVRMRYGELNFATVPLTGKPAIAYVTQAPPVFFGRRPLQVAATVFWPVGISSLVWAAMVAGHARDDLGGAPVLAPAAPTAVGGESSVP